MERERVGSLRKDIEELMGPKFVPEAEISQGPRKPYQTAIKNQPQASAAAGWRTRIAELEKQLSQRRCV